MTAKWLAWKESTTSGSYGLKYTIKLRVSVLIPCISHPYPMSWSLVVQRKKFVKGKLGIRRTTFQNHAITSLWEVSLLAQKTLRRFRFCWDKWIPLLLQEKFVRIRLAYMSKFWNFYLSIPIAKHIGLIESKKFLVPWKSKHKNKGPFSCIIIHVIQKRTLLKFAHLIVSKLSTLKPTFASYAVSLSKEDVYLPASWYSISKNTASFILWYFQAEGYGVLTIEEGGYQNNTTVSMRLDRMSPTWSTKSAFCHWTLPCGPKQSFCKYIAPHLPLVKDIGSLFPCWYILAVKSGSNPTTNQPRVVPVW